MERKQFVVTAPETDINTVVDAPVILFGQSNLASVLSAIDIQDFRFLNLKVIFSLDGSYWLYISQSERHFNHEKMFNEILKTDRFQEGMFGVNLLLNVPSSSVKFSGQTICGKLKIVKNESPELFQFMDLNGFNPQNGVWTLANI